MKRCPRCQSTYPDDAAWCPRDATKLEPIAAAQPGTVTQGWDIPAEPSPASTMPSGLAGAGQHAPAAPPSVTAGWDIPDVPAAPAPHQAPPPSVTAGWDIPDVPASAPSPANSPRPSVTAGWDVPAEPSPNKPSVTAGWDVPPEPSPVSPSALAAAAAFKPGEKITSPASTLPGFAPPADIQAVIMAQRAKVGATKAQPNAEPVIDPAYAAAAQQADSQPVPQYQQYGAPAQSYTPGQQGMQSSAPPQQQQGYAPQHPGYAPPQQPGDASPQQQGYAPPQPAYAPPQQPSYAPPPHHAAPAHQAGASIDEELRAAKQNPTLWIVIAVLGIGAIITAIVLATSG